MLGLRKLKSMSDIDLHKSACSKTKFDANLSLTEDPVAFQGEYLCCGYPKSIDFLRRTSSALYRNYFLYESDVIPKEQQLAMIARNPMKKWIQYVVDSAHKSIHIWIKMPDVVSSELLDLCSLYEEASWKYVAELYNFNISFYDRACKNLSRLGRKPNGIRSDNNQVQKLLYEGECMSKETIDKLYAYLVQYDKEAKAEAQRRKLLSTIADFARDKENNWRDLPFEKKWLTMKQPTENLQLFNDLYNNVSVPSGSNMIGAIFAGAAIHCSEEELMKAANNAHAQHPSNIPKPLRIVQTAVQKSKADLF